MKILKLLFGIFPWILSLALAVALAASYKRKEQRAVRTGLTKDFEQIGRVFSVQQWIHLADIHDIGLWRDPSGHLLAVVRGDRALALFTALDSPTISLFDSAKLTTDFHWSSAGKSPFFVHHVLDGSSEPWLVFDRNADGTPETRFKPDAKLTETAAKIQWQPK